MRVTKQQVEDAKEDAKKQADDFRYNVTREELQSETYSEKKPQGVRYYAEDIEPVGWEWWGYLPRMYTIMSGEEDLGKSFMTCDWAARITRGWHWPNRPPEPKEPKDAMSEEHEYWVARHKQWEDDITGRNDDGPMGVIFIAKEDSIKKTILPRLVVSGADMEKVSFLHVVSKTKSTVHDSMSQPFFLPDHLPALIDEIEAMQARLVVIDPILSTLTVTGENKVARLVINPLVEICELLGVTILAVNHLNKGRYNEENIYSKIKGPRCIQGSARAAILLGRDINDPSQVVVKWYKMNIAKKPDPFNYCIQTGEDGFARVKYTFATREENIADRMKAWSEDSLKRRIYMALLNKGPMQPVVIARLIKANEESVKAICHRMSTKEANPVIVKIDAYRYGIVGRDDKDVSSQETEKETERLEPTQAPPLVMNC